MKIAWLKKFSLIDYPRKISCIIFTPWCSLRCKFCHNDWLVLPEKIKYCKYLIEEDFFDFLDKRTWLLDWVSICWWEPTLQKWLIEFCKKIKNRWFLVKLDTAGVRPDMLKILLDKKLVDYIAMDIKSDLISYEKVTQIKINRELILKSINIIKNSNIDYEFRTTVVKWLHTETEIKNIVKIISWAKNYYLQNYKKWNTLEKSFKWESFTIEELNYLITLCSDKIKNSWIRY